MENSKGKLIDIFIPEQYKNGVLLDIMDRTNIGFKVLVDGEIKEVIVEQDELLKVLEQEFKTIQDANFKAYEELKLDKNSIVLKIKKQHLFTMLIALKNKLPESLEEILKNLKVINYEKERDLIIQSWNRMYEYAKIYYEKNGNLEIPVKFKTNDGYTYDENGTINLGQWLYNQRIKLKPEDERYQKLLEIGMHFENFDIFRWNKMYEYAKIYYEKNGNLEIPVKFKTNDGYTYDENGTINLGQWLYNQRIKLKPEDERYQKLLEIGMRFESNYELQWYKMYEYAKIYYEKNGNLEIPVKFKTNDGYTYDENGTINLGQWLLNQRIRLKPEDERYQKLLEIRMHFGNSKSKLTWKEMYEYAKIYYEHNRNIKIPVKFKTNDGYTYDENGTINLGQWIHTQLRNLKPEDERYQKLLEIGMNFENKRSKLRWEEMYEYAKKYYENHGNLEVSKNFKTNDGYTYDENGTINLEQWINNQRIRLKPEDERYQKLLEIGMNFENKRSTLTWEEIYEYAKIYYQHNKNLQIPANFKTNDGYTYDENGTINLGQWISNQRRRLQPGDEKYKKLLEIGMHFENFDIFRWNRMYEYAKKYYEKNENLEVPWNFKTNDGYTYDENGTINLGQWLLNQRIRLKPEDERYQKLLEIGMRFENRISTLTWEEMYEYAKKYYEKNGNLEVSKNFKTNDGYTYDESGKINLGQWLLNQRQTLDSEDERYQKLLEIGMRFESNYELQWNRMYEYAKIYYEKNGNLEIPQKFKTNDGYTYDENGTINLGQWIHKQRYVLNPEDERYQKLLEIGMRFENKRSILTWEEMYEYAKKYYERHGNLEILQRFKTNDGYTYDENGTINLGKWINTQRYVLNPEDERYQKLLEIGMRFENIKSTLTWKEMYEYAKKYYKHHENLEVSQKFKTNDGYTHDESGKINLGQWIHNQRNLLKPEDERYQKLLEIGMRFENKRSILPWEEMYEYAKKYYERHGNLEILQRFKTNDGYTYDENGTINLGKWINRQRYVLKPEDERYQKLLEIGMRFENIKSTLAWEEMYEYAKKYYEHHVNLQIPSKFKTNDGYTYDENGKINLGQWIDNQRNLVKPDNERYHLLSKIGMIWKVRKNKKQVDEICSQYGIDNNKNITILSHISIQELESKIKFLLDNNLPIINEQGILHEIFNMSSLDMKSKYGNTLEELIEQYYINSMKRM